MALPSIRVSKENPFSGAEDAVVTKSILRQKLLRWVGAPVF